MSDGEGVTRYDVDISVLTAEVKAVNGKLDQFFNLYNDHEARLRSVEKAEELNRKLDAIENRIAPIERWQTAVPVSVVTALVMSIVTAGATIFTTLFA